MDEDKMLTPAVDPEFGMQQTRIWFTTRENLFKKNAVLTSS